MPSRLIKSRLTDLANIGEVEYHNQRQLHEAKFSTLEAWLTRIGDGRVERFHHVRSCVRLTGRVLELGAGSCWLSAEMSKLPAVEEVYALDASETLLTVVAPQVLDALDARQDKITRVVGDFHRLEFPDASFDAVVTDAALHHSTDLDLVLREAHRVLVPGGLLIAIREPVLPDVPLDRQFVRWRRRRAESHASAREQILTLRQWITRFHECGFSVTWELVPGTRRGGPIRQVVQTAARRWPALARILYGLMLHSAIVFYASKTSPRGENPVQD